MNKIEKINAVKATVVRNGERQTLLLHSNITDVELATVEAESGTIVYSVDEAEVKQLVFQAKPAEVTAAPKPAARAVKPPAKTAQPVVEPTSVENTPE